MSARRTGRRLRAWARASTLAAAVALLGAVAVPPAQSTPPVVRVAAASDLRFALDEAAAVLRLAPGGADIQATYGSSGNLHAQLRQRAPFDLFLSADATYPEDLVARGIGSRPDLFTYAIGRLVVWVPRASALPIDRDGLPALSPARRVAIANPAHAPYGRAAEAALRGAGLWAALQPRLLLGDNIAQAAQFVQSGAADAGLIARSLAVANAMRGAGRAREIPADAHAPLVQTGLVLPWAADRAAAAAVRDFLLSDAGQRLLERNGFDLPPR